MEMEEGRRVWKKKEKRKEKEKLTEKEKEKESDNVKRGPCIKGLVHWHLHSSFFRILINWPP